MKILRDPNKEGFQDREASQAYNRTSRWPIFMLERYLLLRSLAKYPPGATLVDIGCGPGFLATRISRRYTQLKVTGLDNNHHMLSLARHNRPENARNLEFVEADAAHLPFASGSIDFIVSSLSLHHWPDARKVFREIYDALKPGGHFIILDLRRDSSRLFYYGLRVSQVLSPSAIRRTNGAVGSFWASYTIAELRDLTSGLGFSSISFESHFGWLLMCGFRG